MTGPGKLVHQEGFGVCAASEPGLFVRAIWIVGVKGFVSIVPLDHVVELEALSGIFERDLDYPFEDVDKEDRSGGQVVLRASKEELGVGDPLAVDDVVPQCVEPVRPDSFWLCLRLVLKHRNLLNP